MTELQQHRLPLSVAVTLFGGLFGLSVLPWSTADPMLSLIALRAPAVYALLYAGYIALLFGTPLLFISVTLALTFIFAGRRQRAAEAGKLPPYPDPAVRTELYLVLGERHHTTRHEPSTSPTWLCVPSRGLFTGIAVIGAVGSGKTSGCLYPFAEQLLAFGARTAERRIGGLVLEVKGDFCHDIRHILESHARGADYFEVSLDGPFRYNPLHNDLDAYALAYGIATSINATFGKGKEPFWQQAYTNLVKFLILLHRCVDGYVTLFDVYRCAIDPVALAAKIAEGEQCLATPTRLLLSPDVLDIPGGLGDLAQHLIPEGEALSTLATPEARAFLDGRTIPYQVVTGPPPAAAAQFEAVKRWYAGDWQRIDPKLRTSIVEGIAVFLSLFDENAALKRVFCPPQSVYGADHASHLDAQPLPTFDSMIENGQVCALNFPTVANPALARLIGTMMKQDFQRAVLRRIPLMARHPERLWREAIFLCDEYHAFATAGEEDPAGDERFFALSRQGKCIPIVATQSVSSLKSALPGESWRTLLQTFRTKVFLAMSDDVSTKFASELTGRAERLVPNYNLSETGQDARISMLTGRAAAHRATISTSKSYHVQRDPVFEAKTFAELKNAQAIALVYDGATPQPPTYCYLKPRHLDRTRTWFEQEARGEI